MQKTSRGVLNNKLTSRAIQIYGKIFELIDVEVWCIFYRRVEIRKAVNYNYFISSNIQCLQLFGAKNSPRAHLEKLKIISKHRWVCCPSILVWNTSSGQFDESNQKNSTEFKNLVGFIWTEKTEPEQIRDVSLLKLIFFWGSLGGKFNNFYHPLG